MDLINTNRLRVSVYDAFPFASYPRRARRVRFSRYRSSDHGNPRLETNLLLEIFDWHLIAKWRPDGKRAEK